MGEVKETEFGNIASEWKFIPATEFCLKVTDGTHDSPKEQSTGKHLITSKHIKGKEVDFENAYLISEEDFNKINERSKVDQWDVIISMIGEYCGFSFVERNENPDYAVKNVGLFKTGEMNKAYWLYYFLNSRIGRYILATNKSGTSQPYLTLGFLRELPIIYPTDESEIEKVVEVLSSLDDKIDLLHRQNKTLEALAETLFRQWFVEDKEWMGKLSEYIKVQGGYAFKSQDFREVGYAGVIKITNISMGSVDIRETQFVDEQIVQNIEDEKFRARTGDFLIAMTGAEIGKIGLVEETDKQIWVNQRVGKLVEKVPYGNIVGYLALKSREGQEHIINTCSGSAQENISSSGLEGMDFTKYSEKEVNGFGLEAKPLFEKILFNMNQIRTLTQLRDILLPKLMSGEVRVKN